MPLTRALLAQAATELIARRTAARQGPRLPELCRPADLEDGWQVQQEVTRRLGQPIGGWKASLPGPGKLGAAPIYQPSISRAAVCAVASKDALNLEPELAFVLAHDLPARAHAYTEAEVDAAVGSVHAALEICASRYSSHAGLPFPELLADIDAGIRTTTIAYRFHQTVAAAATDVCLQIVDETGLDRVILSGGVFQNRLLSEMIYTSLTLKGLRVFTHRLVPPNDGGLALGQAAIAGRRKV